MTPVDDWNLSAAISNNGAPFAYEDVKRVVADWTDGADEPEFIWLLELNDGRWAAVYGGCDYTGWDCRSSLTATVHASREEAVRFGLTLNQRELLGVLLPDDAEAPHE